MFLIVNVGMHQHLLNYSMLSCAFINTLMSRGGWVLLQWPVRIQREDHVHLLWMKGRGTDTDLGLQHKPCASDQRAEDCYTVKQQSMTFGLYKNKNKSYNNKTWMNDEWSGKSNMYTFSFFTWTLYQWSILLWKCSMHSHILCWLSIIQWITVYDKVLHSSCLEVVGQRRWYCSELLVSVGAGVGEASLHHPRVEIHATM